MLPCWACGTLTNAREDAWSLPVLYCPPCYNHFWDLAVEANKVERQKPVPRARTRTSTTEPMIDDEGSTFEASSPKPAKRQKRVTFAEPSFSEPTMDVKHIKKIAEQLDQLTRTNFSYRFKLQRKYRKLQKLQDEGRTSEASSFLALDMLMAKNKLALGMIKDSFKVTRDLLDRIERGTVTVYDYGIMREELVKIKSDLQETERLVNEVKNEIQPFREEQRILGNLDLKLRSQVKQFSEETEAEIPATKAKLKEIGREHKTSTTAKKKKQLGIVKSHRLILEKLKHLSALNKEREELEMQIQIRDHLRLIDENQSSWEQVMDADEFQKLEKKCLKKFRKICADNELEVPSGWGDDVDEGPIEEDQQKSQRDARKEWQQQTEKFLDKVERSKYSTSSDSSSASSGKSVGDGREEEQRVRRVQDDKGIISQEEKIKKMESDLETADQLMKILRELEKLDVANSTERNGEILKKTRRRLTANDLIKRLEGMNIDEDRTGSSFQLPETPESLAGSDDSSNNDNGRPSAVPAETPSRDSLASIRFTGKQEKLVNRVVQENIRSAMQSFLQERRREPQASERASKVLLSRLHVQKKRHPHHRFLMDDHFFHHSRIFNCAGKEVISSLDKPDVDENGKPVTRCTTPLHHAVGCEKQIVEIEKKSSSIDVIDDLFSMYDRFDVNYTNEDGLTHLHVASHFGRVNIAKKFLDHGADPNDVWTSKGYSTLHLALEAKYIFDTIVERRSMFRLLLKSGANPNLADAQGRTPLHIVCKKIPRSWQSSVHPSYDWFLAKMIFSLCHEKYGPVQVNARDKEGNTPLNLALKTGNKCGPVAAEKWCRCEFGRRRWSGSQGYYEGRRGLSEAVSREMHCSPPNLHHERSKQSMCAKIK
ncbi:unnamed protein product [Trichogramma brassicae]|uniref:Uncharacterized protein n=1 Tax=Trichogramma brassicae TaxID=86971 RepID=A0A6H5HXL5_9HYME|nr:unnamed protein product [Trichogramma brassicae]